MQAQIKRIIKKHQDLAKAFPLGSEKPFIYVNLFSFQCKPCKLLKSVEIYETNLSNSCGVIDLIAVPIIIIVLSYNF